MQRTTMIDSLNTILKELSDDGVEFERYPQFFFYSNRSAYIHRIIEITEKEVSFAIISDWDTSVLLKARKQLYTTMTVQEYHGILENISGTISVTINVWNKETLPQILALAANHMRHRTER